MKIAHICISAPYIDGWGYQENLLPAYLCKVGCENVVIAPSDTFPNYLSPDEVERIKAKGKDYSIGAVRIIRIPTVSVTSSFIIPKGLESALESIKPDAIFHHNVNPTSLLVAGRYSHKHKVPLFVDNHADEINMSSNILWHLVYYNFACRLACRYVRKTLSKAYGVTVSRCHFLKKYYGIPENLVDFLPIGADVSLADTLRDRTEIRSELGVSDKDFLVVSGGKMSEGKGTDNLIKSVEELANNGLKVRLVLFGKFEDERTRKLAVESRMTNVKGWCERTETLELLKAADVVCWPVHHTTLCEDAIAVGTPLILRKTDTTSHLIEGNGIWLETSSENGLKNALNTLACLSPEMRKAVSLACRLKKESLSYVTLAKKVLNDINVAAYE